MITALGIVPPLGSMFGLSLGILVAPLAMQEMVLAVWLIANPVSAADDVRRTMHPEMRTWLGKYLARQPACGCPPLLRLGTSLGADGQPSEMVVVIIHDGTRCPLSGEPVTIPVSRGALGLWPQTETLR